jgi:hypothetical protein
MNPPELLQQCAKRLFEAQDSARKLSAFVGLDGFVDEIIHVVDKRDNAESFQRVPSIAKLAERIAGASGKSTNIELVNIRTKLGGNGPIMANALAHLGLKVTYLGALGYPIRHPIFDSFAENAEIHSVAEFGHTDALEFEDGKLMFGKTVQLNDVTWENIQARFGKDRFLTKFQDADLVAFVNWTMIPYMSDIWDALLKDLCPHLTGPKRKIFFDLADPEKRTLKDMTRAMELIHAFEKHFEVILGLNEKEAYEIGSALGYSCRTRDADGLSQLALQIHQQLQISNLVVHPVSYALAVSASASGRRPF